MLKDLGRRTVVSICAIGALAGLIFFSEYLVPLIALLLIGTLFTGVCVWEYAQLAHEKGAQLPRFLPVLGALLALSLCMGSFLTMVLFTLFALVIFLMHFNRTSGSIFDLSASIFALIYVALPIGMILAILYRSPGDSRFWLAYLLIVTKISDMGAYFAGGFLGRTKFLASISPSKTLEGAIGGLICAMGASYLFHLWGLLGPVEWAVLGAVLSVIAQAGDFAESLLKRDANKKDSNSLPGLGGALDTVDSLLFSAPILYFYLGL